MICCLVNKGFFFIMLILHVWFPSDGEGGGRGREEGWEGGREGGRELKVISEFILHHRRSAFCKRRIPSRLKESRPSRSHALLRIRRKRLVRSSIS